MSMVRTYACVVMHMRCGAGEDVGMAPGSISTLCPGQMVAGAYMCVQLRTYDSLEEAGGRGGGGDERLEETVWLEFVFLSGLCLKDTV